MLHDASALGSAYEMRGLFEAFRGERPVIAVDLPGFGFSERPSLPLTRLAGTTLVEELVADVSRRYGASVDVVAVGIAGELAARAALTASRNVRSLTLVSPTGFMMGRAALGRPRAALPGRRVSQLRYRQHAD